MSLITRHRPKTLDEIAGNQGTVQALRAILDRSNDKLPRSFMFSGPPGCGKTTLGRIVAKALGCAKQDLEEVDTAQYTGVDAIREIRQRMHYKPLDGDVRVWILDECHRLSGNAQDSLLKALEEPPAHVFFILCTTEPKSVRQAVIRRCSHHEVKALSEKQTMLFLKRIINSEEAAAPRDVIRQIAEDSIGRPGVALQILDKVIDLPEDEMLTVAKQHVEFEGQIIDLCRALIRKSNWSSVCSILDNLNEDPETIRRAVLGYGKSILLKKDEPRAYLILDAFIEPFYQSGMPGVVWACYQVLKG